MYRAEKNGIPDANVGESVGTPVKERMALPPALKITRRFRPNSKRNSTICFICFVFVLVTIVFSCMIISPSLPSTEHVNDNRSQDPESSNLPTKKLSRKLLQSLPASDNETTMGTLKINPKINDSQIDKDSPFPKDVFTDSQRTQGAIILYVIGVLYIVYAIVLLCDKFFVPALNVITAKLGISSDVTGATFMAVGGCLPALITRLIGIFFAHGDHSFGSIVGAAVFNILSVVAACAFAAKEALRLTAWPLMREVFFYVISLVLLVLFFLDEQIVWYEALILLLWYGVYIVFMVFNDAVKNKCRKCRGIDQEQNDIPIPDVTERPTTEDVQPTKTEGGEEEIEEPPIDMTFPKHSLSKNIVYIISFPIMAPLYLTLPDMKNKEFTIFPSFKVPGITFFVWTFLGSIVWIAFFTYLIVWWAAVIGETFGIPPKVMGLTFLAVGVFSPDLIASILVTRQGKVDMAVSSAFGSNIFNVTVGLPFPWLLWCIIKGTVVFVSTEGAACSVAILFLMLILVFSVILCFKFKMNKCLGVIMIVLYILFVFMSLGFQFNYYSCPVGPVQIKTTK